MEKKTVKRWLKKLRKHTSFFGINYPQEHLHDHSEPDYACITTCLLTNEAINVEYKIVWICVEQPAMHDAQFIQYLIKTRDVSSEVVFIVYANGSVTDEKCLGYYTMGPLDKENSGWHALVHDS